MTKIRAASVAAEHAKTRFVVWLGARRRSLVLVVLASVGGLLLGRQVGGIRPALSAIAHADPGGLAATILLGAATYLAAAVALTAASGRPLSLARTSGMQLAAACTNRIVPAGIGGMVTNARYLEREGVPRSEAIAAVGLTSVTSFAVHVAATGIALALASVTGTAPSLRLPTLPGLWPVASLALVGVVGGVAYTARSRGLAACASLRSGWSTVSSLRRDPRRLTSLLLGTTGVTLGHALAFAAATRACGVHVGIGGLILVFLAGSAIGNAAPTPGGLGALEAALTAGLTGLGAHAAAALAGVLTFRLVTYWLPVLPGAVAFRALVPRAVTSGHPERPSSTAVPVMAALGR